MIYHHEILDLCVYFICLYSQGHLKFSLLKMRYNIKCFKRPVLECREQRSALMTVNNGYSPHSTVFFPQFQGARPPTLLPYCLIYNYVARMQAVFQNWKMSKALRLDIIQDDTILYTHILLY